MRSRRGRDVTDEYPQFKAVAADLADHHVILDGEAVALDESGVPSFGEMQNRARSTRVEFWAFDILHLDGRSLLRAKYSDRRRMLEALADGGGLIVPPALPGDGPRRWRRARATMGRCGRQEAGLHVSAGSPFGVVGQGQDLEHPGSRDRRLAAGEGGRTSGIGALMLGIPAEGGLHFAGRVGTGFTDKALKSSRRRSSRWKPTNHRSTRLSTPDAKGVTFVRPELVGEVRYSERTSDGRLRQPSWRGCGRTRRRTRSCGSSWAKYLRVRARRWRALKSEEVRRSIVGCCAVILTILRVVPTPGRVPKPPSTCRELSAHRDRSGSCWRSLSASPFAEPLSHRAQCAAMRIRSVNTGSARKVWRTPRACVDNDSRQSSDSA